MDLKRLPFLPLNFFFHQLNKANKTAFVIGMALLGLSVGAWLFSYQNPTAYSIEVNAVPETLSEQVAVDTVEASYRSFPLTFDAYRQQVFFSASPITPPNWAFVVAFVVLALAWSLLLANASVIRSRWAFLFYLLFAIWIHTTGVASLIVDHPWGSRGVELVIMLIFLGVAYAFQSNMLKGRLGLRFGVMAALSALVFGLAYGLSGKGGLVFHQMMGESFIYLSILTLILVLFVSKEPTNLLVYLATNRANPTNRLKAPFVYIGLGLLQLVNLFWLDHYLGWNFVTQETPGFRPSHLLAMAFVLTPFLSQNHYHQVRNIFSTLGVFTLMLVIWPLIGVVFLWANLAAFDPLMAYTIDRMAAITFTGVGVGHVLFILMNHIELIRHRINMYYLMADGPRVGFTMVWLLGLTLWVFAEGSENWKTPRLLSHGYALHQADQFWLEGNQENAAIFYEISIRLAGSSPKAHHNLASIQLADQTLLGEAVTHYQKASRSFDFPYGYLNAASLFRLNNQSDQAMQVMESALERYPDQPQLLNNLGNIWLEKQEPDSAIKAYQAALKADLSQAATYSNLAQLYWQYDREKSATEFFQAAVELSDPGTSVLLSSIWYQLQTGEKLDMPGLSGEGLDDPLLIYNYQLLHLDEGDTVGRGVIRSMADQGAAPDAMLLDGYLLFLEGDIERALSRLEYLAEGYDAYAAPANYLIGVSYYQLGLPEMAKGYFEKQARVGDPQGRFLAAVMDIDLGRAEEANAALSLLRAEEEEYFEPASREIAMLLKAYGQDLYAQLEYDLSKLSYEEKIRMGRYADSMQYFSTALRIYQDLIAKDTARIEPYLEMGRIYNRYCDELAGVNLRLGLEQAADSRPLRLAYVESLLCEGKVDSAAYLLSQVAEDDLEDEWQRRLKAQLTLQQGDTAMSAEILSEFIAEQPLARDAILDLAGIYQQQEDYFALNQLMGVALRMNDQHPLFWYYFAWSSRGLGYGEDAAYGARMAIELAFNSQQAATFDAEFEEVLRQYPDEG